AVAGWAGKERGPRSLAGSRAPPSPSDPTALAWRAPGSITCIVSSSGRERMSAPAATSGVRVLERETGSLHRRHVVDRDVVQVLRRKRIDEELEPVLLHDEIIFRRLVFDQQTVFEAAAAAWLHADAQAADLRRHAFGVHETLDLGNCTGGHDNRDFGLL